MSRSIITDSRQQNGDNIHSHRQTMSTGAGTGSTLPPRPTSSTTSERAPLLGPTRAVRHSSSDSGSLISSTDGDGGGNGDYCDSESLIPSTRSLPPPPPPPPLPPQLRHPLALPARTTTTGKISSLDFERVVNEYSIQATKDRYISDDATPATVEIDNNKATGQIRRRRRRRPPPPPPPSTELGSNRSAIPANACSNNTDNHNHNHNMNGTPPTPARHTKVSTGRTATRWALSAIIGLCTGLTTNLIVVATGAIVKWREEKLDVLAQSNRYSDKTLFGLYVGFNVILAVAASGLCVYVAPEGTGSGIPEVKAYLNGVRVKKFSSWRLFGVKIVGTILSVASFLAVGMEGPLIHIGAIIGASVTKLASVLSRVVTRPTTRGSTSATIDRNSCSSYGVVWQRHVVGPVTQFVWTFATTNLAHFSIDAERRDFISIGASVGFAASFGAPIGGLLFVLDDISSYFSKNMFLRTLVANAIGTFCLAIQSGNLSNYSIINLGTYQGASDDRGDIFLNRFEFIPLYVVVGILGGALGGLFCCSFEYIKVHVTDRLTTPKAKLGEVAVLSIVTSILTFGLPIFSWACKPVLVLDDDNDIAAADRHHHNFDQGRQFFCGPGEVNEMATIMFGSRTEAIKRMLSDPAQFQQRTLWTVGFLFYGLMTVTYGSIIPSGIFTPTVLIGASLGGAVGLAFQEFIPDITPSTFALLGVAAMLAGIQRSTVSISVILVEGTGQIKVLLPVVVVVLVARAVAECFHLKGLYETSMLLKRYPYLDHEEKRRYDMFQVKEIMSCPVEVIGPIEKASHLVRMLQGTLHNGFPVVDPRTKKFLGLVRRDQIIALLECGVFEEGNFTANDGTSHSMASDISATSSPRPGIGKSPMMHWAYHIKDDRYDHLKNQYQYAPDVATAASTDTDGSITGHADEFDRHEWIRSIHDTLRTMPKEVAQKMDGKMTLVPTAGDDTMPPLRYVLTVANQHQNQGHDVPPNKNDHDLSVSISSTVSSNNAAPKGFATVGVNERGNLMVTWMNPIYQNAYVNLAAVMNRGSYVCPEFLPVSKARFLFTQLGLRHVVVLGGESGGEVTGVFTRANLMPSYIEERTHVVF